MEKIKWGKGLMAVIGGGCIGASADSLLNAVLLVVGVILVALGFQE